MCTRLRLFILLVGSSSSSSDLTCNFSLPFFEQNLIDHSWHCIVSHWFKNLSYYFWPYSLPNNSLKIHCLAALNRCYLILMIYCFVSLFWTNTKYEWNISNKKSVLNRHFFWKWAWTSSNVWGIPLTVWYFLEG